MSGLALYLAGLTDGPGGTRLPENTMDETHSVSRESANAVRTGSFAVPLSRGAAIGAVATGLAFWALDVANVGNLVWATFCVGVYAGCVFQHRTARA